MEYGQLSRYLLQAPSYFPSLISFLCHVLQEILPACWSFHHSRYLQNIYYALSTWIGTRDSYGDKKEMVSAFRNIMLFLLSKILVSPSPNKLFRNHSSPVFIPNKLKG